VQPESTPVEPASGPEAAILAAVERGDRRGAVDALMRLYGGETYRFCVSMLGDRALADDVHQTVFVDAYQALVSFAGRATLRAWLYGIARHRCLDAAKARRRWFARFTSAPAAVEAEADPGPSADGVLEDRRRSDSLQRCLKALPPHVRVAVLLRYEDDLSYEEIGRMSRERAPAVQARVARALPVLRRCLAERRAA
jgi:RNA polymerase sigma-70 factor (ECF subfamily)